MSNFFDDIITPNTMNTMKHLGENFDSYNFGIHQLLNFQFMLYNALNELAAKFTSLKTEVSFLGNQLLNIDDAVANYMRENPVEVYTRDGVPIDDALSVLQEKITSLNDHITTINEKNEKFEVLLSEAATKESVSDINAELERTTETGNETVLAVQMIQKEITRQKSGDDTKWEVVRDMFRQQVEQYGATIDQKVDLSDLSEYVKHTELAELTNLFRSVPDDCKTRIPEIIPQVMRLTGLSMDEKLQRAYELLHIERERIDTEKQQLNEAFQSLQQNAVAHQQYTEKEHQTDFIDCEVRDVGVDSGFYEVSEPRYQQIKRYSKRSSVSTNFDGPEKIFSEKEEKVTNVISDIIQNNKEFPGFNDDNDNNPAPNFNIQGITTKVIVHCQEIIERQLGLLMNSLGFKIDKNEISTLVNQLTIVEDIQKQIEAINIKMSLKIDQSMFKEELKKYLLKDEFYEKCGDLPNNPLNNSMTVARSTLANNNSMLHKVTSKSTVGKRPKTEQRNRPVTLVPARNPYMMGVNDKYLKGKDNKLYLRETMTVPDKSYKEPPITGTSKSYFERSKMAAELDGVEAVIDFQPFVPADEVQNKKNSVAIVQVEPYQFESTS